MTNSGAPQHVDEAAVLAELEKLREAIHDAKSLREQKVAEFESFVQTTRVSARVESARAAGISLDDEPTSSGPASAHAVRADGPTASAIDRQAAHHLPPIESGVEALASHEDRFAPGSALARIGPRTLATGSAILVAFIAGVMFIAARQDESSGSPASASTPGPVTPSRGPQPMPGATAGSTPAVVQKRALQIELTTLRPVWLRVVVDGEKVVERQVPGGERLPFGADRAISIRAGDAGAVRLAIGGDPGAPLGGDGQVVSRTLVPPGR